MTRQEAAKILAALASGWPGVTIASDQAEVWFHAALTDIDFEVGLEAVMHLIGTEERFPSIARFNAARRMKARRSAEDEPRHALEVGVPLSTGSRMAKIARLINAETPGWGGVEDPRRPTSEPVHHDGIEPGPCAFCQDRLALSDAELNERLAAAGLS